MKKNILVITFGTREVQFKEADLKTKDFFIKENRLMHKAFPPIALEVTANDNYPGYYFFRNPRRAGKIMLEYSDVFLSILSFPLLHDVFNRIIDSNKINELVIVYTDQQDLDTNNKQNERNYNRDTVYYSKLFRKYIPGKFSHLADNALHDIGITEKATDIDYQYNEFAKKLVPQFGEPENIEKIFLLPQGGIDQINHALTLQLIQAYGSKIKLWQQPEGERPLELQFPFMFIWDLQKQKILKHLDDYDFGLIAEMGIEKKHISELAAFAHRKLNLDYSREPACAANYKEEDNPETRLRDIYINAKIHFKKGDYANYIWRIFTIMENIYRFKCDQILGNTEKFNHPQANSQEWLELLDRYEGLTDFLKKKKIGFHSLNFDRPNRNVYKHIYNFFINRNMLDDSKYLQNNLNRAFNESENLVKLRNGLAHYLQPVSREIIESAMNNISLTKLNATLDKVFQTKEKQFGIYEEINSELRKKLENHT
jgi:SOS response regulatory protein OraA/RecX